MIDSEPVDDLGRLQRQAFALEANAEALTRAYNRATWIRFLLVFIPVPFVGALFIVCGTVLFSLDSAASAKCDAATEAAASARQAFEEAQTTRHEEARR
jgi:hypothetical protein